MSLGSYVAQYKFTVLLMPNGPHKITGNQLLLKRKWNRVIFFHVAGLPFDESLVKSDKSLQDEEILKLLKTSASAKAAKKKKKAAEKAAVEESEAAAPQLVTAAN